MVIHRRRCGRPSCWCADGGVAPRAGGPQLLRGEQDEVGVAARRSSRAGPPGDGALSTGSDAPGGGGEYGLGGAGEEPRSGWPGEDAFSASTVLCDGLTAFLSGGWAADLTHEQLESRLESLRRGLVRQLYQDHPAPRGALTYPPRSGEGLEVIIPGSNG